MAKHKTLSTPNSPADIDIVITPAARVLISSADPDQYQWLTAIARLMSSASSHGVPLAEQASELLTVFDPRGGRLHPETHHLISLVGEIGLEIKRLCE